MCPRRVQARTGIGFVQHCIGAGLGGVENLSLIPGCVGASPMQNIGAYGVEIKEVFQEISWRRITCPMVPIERFSVNDCGFGYRDSVFKGRYRDQFAILHVTFRLRKQPVFHTSYGAIEQELERVGVTELSLRAISEAVIRIRTSKLPDPQQIGLTPGAFLQNPVVGAGGLYGPARQVPCDAGVCGGPGTLCGRGGHRRHEAGRRLAHRAVRVEGLS